MIGIKQTSPSMIFKVNEGSHSEENTKKVIWNEKYESKLLNLVDKYHGKNWKKIAELMQKTFNEPKLTAKKCRERWCNCTNPKLDRSSLTNTEELFLLVYHYMYKNNWSLISQHLNHRNSSKLKNNFSSLARKISRKISLDETCVFSTIEFIQVLYVAILIHDLILINEDDTNEIIRLVPIHIYKHVSQKNLTHEKCLNYIKKISTNYIDEVILINEEKFNNINFFKSLLQLTIYQINRDHTPSRAPTEKNLLTMIKSISFHQIFSIHKTQQASSNIQMDTGRRPSFDNALHQELLLNQRFHIMEQNFHANYEPNYPIIGPPLYQTFTHIQPTVYPQGVIQFIPQTVYTPVMISSSVSKESPSSRKTSSNLPMSFELRAVDISIIRKKLVNN